MKVHGFKIKMTAFLPAEPFNVDDLTAAQQKFAGLCDWLEAEGFNDVELATEPGAKKRPDEPKAAQAVQSAADDLRMPEIPPAQRRA